MINPISPPLRALAEQNTPLIQDYPLPKPAASFPPLKNCEKLI